MGIVDKLWDDTIGGPEPLRAPHKLYNLNTSAAASPKSSLDYGDSPRPSDSSLSRTGSSFDEANVSIPPRRSADYQESEARKISQSIAIATRKGVTTTVDRATSLPSQGGRGPFSSSTSSPSPRMNENVWVSVFHPGSNKLGMDRVHGGGSGRWDSNESKSPSVFDWMYNPKSRSQYR